MEPVFELDKAMYSELIKGQNNEFQTQQLEIPQSWSAFIVLLVLKLIPLGLFLSDPFMTPILTQRIMNQLILLFTVGQFWFTKNVVGRKMIGLRWGFEDNFFGQEELYYEARANRQYRNPLTVLLFWIVESLYVLLPLIFLVLQFFTAPNVSQVNFRWVILTMIIFGGAFSNYFFFIKAALGNFRVNKYIDCSKKQDMIEQKLGKKFLRELTTVSFKSVIIN